MDDSVTRRGVLGTAATALGASALAITTATQEQGEGGGGSDAPPDYGGWFDAVGNYDGTTVDARGQATVTVTVAAEGNGGNFAFEPPAVHVDNGATVRWEWTGEGGAHNVLSDSDGPLDSGEVIGEAGVHYEYTFEEDGIYPYYCGPHQGQGMKGAVVVGTDYPTRTPATPTAEPTPTPEPTPEGEALPAAPATDWPSREFGPANRSFTDETTGPVADVSERWRLQFDHVLFDPVLAGGTLYVSTDEYTTVAVDARTGDRQWEREIPGRVRAVDDGRVYVTSRGDDGVGGFVFALDTETGETVWARQDAEDSVAGLQVAAGRVFAAVGGTVERFDAATGSRQRLADIGGEVVGLAVVNGTVYASGQRYFGTSPHEPELWVRAFDADSGAQQWTFSRESFPPTRPTVADGMVYVGSGSHAIHALDASDGSERWTAELGSAVRGVAAVPDDAPDAVSGTVYAGCGDYYLYAFDAGSGDRRWRTRTRGTVNTPAVAGDVVYAANRGYIVETNDDGSVRYDEDGSIDRDKAVHGFDGATGETLWTVELDSLVSDGTTPAYFGAEPLVADGAVYLTTNASDGTFTLYAIGGAASGDQEATATPEATGTGGTTGADGSGFTAVAAALGLVGAAGLQEWRRRVDDRR